jgi:undecaprenyl-diphosphatase
MITWLQALLLGLLQGVTELFPISSLGHSILFPALFGWHLDQNATTFVEFLVATHCATALVLVWIYRADWLRIIRGIFRSLRDREIGVGDRDAKLGWLLVAGTIPAGIIGLVFENSLKMLFAAPRIVAVFLIINGVMLALAEFLRLRAKASKESEENADARLAMLTWWQSIKIGTMQILALIPGISRTGAAMTGGLTIGLSHEDSLRFSFLLATPIIGAAALLELPGLFAAGPNILWAALVGAIAAACGAYASAKFLVRYFKTKTLLPFALYCAAIGIVGLLLVH